MCVSEDHRQQLGPQGSERDPPEQGRLMPTELAQAELLTSAGNV